MVLICPAVALFTRLLKWLIGCYPFIDQAHETVVVSDSETSSSNTITLSSLRD